ncbi:serine/threonine protein kinase [Catenulispora acidiphila DSM 44928]|uniref:Serine/threonine protein kinase n=1 Tax=Catenulispora acidiphila (strain DSM 44928 / JCM 14897 / NBRC 102108 / NRRL B-24433 / ID139908) TaxID=479433 RepID=C7PYX2_CATAD|nr:serine/threonine-protein kinase [Catenulispora acidiphila]ACU69528.1 serine/threonine protein kinase [Catenulispora acidiphila DSM 44928]
MDALKPEDPSRVGPFTPLARIGAGGMGRVYLARSRGGRPVAVKVIRAEYAEDERFRTRFRREVQAARTVDGMYTAPVLDAGPDDAEPWLATAYIPGPSLQRAVHEHGPLPERTARVMGAGIAEALGAIHSAGLIHRDLKPSNVILGPDGPRVIDFGISASEGGSSLTTTGIVVGSPRYSSPEQCRADPALGPASDVFALGGVMVYATTGVPPFGDGPDHVQLYLVVHETPDLTGVPMGLRPIVSACLEKDPANRPTTDELLDTLLPPEEAGATNAVDWLPDAVYRDLREYSAAPIVALAAGTTHERGEDSARTPAPGEATPTGAGFDGGGVTGIGSGVGTTAAPSSAGSDGPSNPGRRRMLAGIAGAVVVAAGGGGAWYAATRDSGRKSATQSAGATFPPSTGSQNPSTPAAPSTTPTPSTTPSTTPTPTPSHVLGPWQEDWSSKTDLGGASGGAVISGSKLVGVYTATSVSNPIPPQDLIAIDTVSGGSAFPARSIPAVDNVGGAGIAADDTHAYSYGAGTVYAWNLSDGSAAWNAKSGLQTSTSTNNMPTTGILGMVGTLLMVGSGNYDPGFPPCLAAFDVTLKKAVWTLKPEDMQIVASPPTGLVLNQTSIAVSIPKLGNLFYVMLCDENSLRVLKAMDMATGKEVWHVFFEAYSDNGAGTVTPTVTGTEQHVYLTDMHSGSVHAYSAAGKWMWTYPSAVGKTAPSSDRRFTGQVLESGDAVYAADANRVYALQVSTKAVGGTPVWKNPATFNGIANVPALVGDKIWVEVHTPTEKNPLAMIVVDTADGQVVHSYPMPEGPTASSAELTVPDPSGQAAYVLTASGQVLGYRRNQ